MDRWSKLDESYSSWLNPCNFKERSFNENRVQKHICIKYDHRSIYALLLGIIVVGTFSFITMLASIMTHEAARAGQFCGWENFDIYTTKVRYLGYVLMLRVWPTGY